MSFAAVVVAAINCMQTTAMYGPQGDDGPRGVRGPPGLPGPAGKCGENCCNAQDSQQRDNLLVDLKELFDKAGRLEQRATESESTIRASSTLAAEALQFAKNTGIRSDQVKRQSTQGLNEAVLQNNNQLEELQREVMLRQTLMTLGGLKAESAPCARCRWLKTARIVQPSRGAALLFPGPGQEARMTWDSGTEAQQQWTHEDPLVKSSDGSQCLGFTNEWNVFSKMVSEDCNGANTQQLVYSSLTGHLKTVWGNQCMDFNGDSLHTWDCQDASNANQIFTFSEDAPSKPMNCPDTCIRSEQQIHIISHRDGLALQAIPDQQVDTALPNAFAEEQLFNWNADTLQIQTGQGQGKKCFAISSWDHGVQLSLEDCNPSVKTWEQVFVYLKGSNQIKSAYGNLCLDNGGQAGFAFWPCDANNAFQKFDLA